MNKNHHQFIVSTGWLSRAKAQLDQFQKTVASFKEDLTYSLDEF